jgi:acyl carrier protein
MTLEEIKESIIQEILRVAPEIDKEEIKPNENLQRSLEIDSFDSLKVLTALSEKFGIEIPEKDYSKVDTLEHTAKYISERI